MRHVLMAAFLLSMLAACGSGNYDPSTKDGAPLKYGLAETQSIDPATGKCIQHGYPFLPAQWRRVRYTAPTPKNEEEFDAWINGHPLFKNSPCHIDGKGVWRVHGGNPHDKPVMDWQLADKANVYAIEGLWVDGTTASNDKLWVGQMGTGPSTGGWAQYHNLYATLPTQDWTSSHLDGNPRQTSFGLNLAGTRVAMLNDDSDLTHQDLEVRLVSGGTLVWKAQYTTFMQYTTPWVAYGENVGGTTSDYIYLNNNDTIYKYDMNGSTNAATWTLTANSGVYAGSVIVNLINSTTGAGYITDNAGKVWRFTLGGTVVDSSTSICNGTCNSTYDTSYALAAIDNTNNVLYQAINNRVAYIPITTSSPWCSEVGGGNTACKVSYATMPHGTANSAIQFNSVIPDPSLNYLYGAWDGQIVRFPFTVSMGTVTVGTGVGIDVKTNPTRSITGPPNWTCPHNGGPSPGFTVNGTNGVLMTDCDGQLTSYQSTATVWSQHKALTSFTNGSITYNCNTTSHVGIGTIPFGGGTGTNKFAYFECEGSDNSGMSHPSAYLQVAQSSL